MMMVNLREEEGKNIVSFSGRIDSGNATEVENKVIVLDNSKQIILDLEELEYISSAGLRVILKLRKKHTHLEIINASTEVYEILEMTGFTDMMSVSRIYKTVSIEGCEVIGQGANGKVYRLDPDTVVKVYLNPDSIDEIKHEREVARKALILGIPTAISYDIVKVNDCYASRFEMLNAKSFSKLIAESPQNIDEYANMYVDLLKLIHSTNVPEGELPDVKETALGWLSYLKQHLPEHTYHKLRRLVEAVPKDNHMIHGDYHTKNIMLQNGEVILIDMDTLSVGNPVFEFASMYLSYIGYGILNHDNIGEFIGFPFEVAEKFWKKSLALYYGTTDEQFLKQKEENCMVIGYIRMLRRTIKRMGNTEEGKALITYSKEKLIDLAERVESLV